jgi:molybdate transport system substrate-binding protein
VPDVRELNVLTTVALKRIFEGLAEEFHAATGYGLVMTYAPGGIVVKRVREGVPADIMVATPEAIATLVGEGLALAGSGRTLGSSVIGVAVRAEAKRPAIGTAAEFRAALIAAKSVAYTDPSTGAASGVHFVQLLDRFGITEAVRAKAKLGDGGPVAEFVARGEAEMAIQQLSEHMLVPGVDVVGPIPAELNKVTLFAAGVAAASRAPREAAALIELLAAPHIQQRLPAHGLTPAG